MSLRKGAAVVVVFGVFFFLAAVANFALVEARTDSSSDGSFSIAVLSDTHIGEGVVPFYNGQVCNTTIRLTKAIEWINARIEEYDIRWVFITGDITSSAEPTQFAKARELLDTLKVPYFPIIGNHDMWPYNSQMETMIPIGDQVFASTFNESFTIENVMKVNSSKGVNLDLFYYGNNKTWNPENQVYSYFQNYMMTVTNDNSSKVLVFMCMDWNTRHPAILMDKNKGALGNGDLHDYPGGTLPWLQERLAELSALYNDIKAKYGTEMPMQVIFLQHQPYKTPWYIPRWTFTFDDEQERKIQEAMEGKNGPALPIDAYWGVIAGHLHRWWNSTAFDFPPEWTKFWQWETNACKGQWNNETLASAFTIVTFEDYKIADLIPVQPPPV